LYTRNNVTSTPLGNLRVALRGMEVPREGIRNMYIPQNIQADRLIPCPVCNAAEGKGCKSTDKQKITSNQSHFGRRLKRMLTLGVLPKEKL
jgi:hypothetical protein